MIINKNDNCQATTEAITGKAVDSLKWSALMEVVSRTAQPVIFIILARLLAPFDFGVLATAMIVISFAQMFWDAGLSKALVQTNESPEEAAHVVFWTNLVLGVLIYAILFITAPTIGVFFNSPLSGPVLRLLGIQIVIASLSSVQQALFVRKLDFRALFWIKLLTAFVPGLCSIPLALFGYGVWALVVGALAGQVLNLWLLWQRSLWRPKFVFDKNLAQKLFEFGFWVLLESFGAWFIVWGDNLIVGRFLGVHALGVYRTGWMLVTIIFGLVLNPFLPVLYPIFSRLQDDLPALISTFHRVNRIVFALALPMGTGLLLVGSEAAILLFGGKWQGLGFVLAVLGITHSISWLVSLNTEIYRAMGKPQINTMLMYAHIAYYLPCFYIAAQFGLETFTIIRLAVALVAIPIQTYFCVKMLGVSPFYLWQKGKPMILACFCMALGIAIMKWGLLPGVLHPPLSISLAIMIGSGAVLYVFVLWFLDRCFVRDTMSLMRKAWA